MQLMLLEQQNKKRLLMARQEQDSLSAYKPGEVFSHDVPDKDSSKTLAQKDYEMQLMLLEQQNKKRLLLARQEQDDTSRWSAAEKEGRSSTFISPHLARTIEVCFRDLQVEGADANPVVDRLCHNTSDCFTASNARIRVIMIQVSSSWIVHNWQPTNQILAPDLSISELIIVTRTWTPTWKMVPMTSVQSLSAPCHARVRLTRRGAARTA